MLSEAWIPVLSGFVGAGGAVSAQVVSARFTAKRELVSRRALAFRDEKRDLFASVLGVMEVQASRLRLLAKKHEHGGEFDIDGFAAIQEREKEVADLTLRVELLAPEVLTALANWSRVFTDCRENVPTEPDDPRNAAFTDHMDTLDTARWVLVNKMQESLGTDIPVEDR